MNNTPIISSLSLTALHHSLIGTAVEEILHAAMATEEILLDAQKQHCSSHIAQLIILLQHL